MKGKIVTGLCILFSLIAFAGCGGKKEAEPAPADAEGTRTEAAAGSDDGTQADEGFVQEAKAFDTDIISDMYAAEGTLDIAYEAGEEVYSYDYSYHVPQITEDSEGAREINALIHSDFDEVMEVLEKCKNHEDGYYEISLREISYETFWNSSLLSIVITSQSNFEDFIGYGVYTYDAATGLRVSNEELLAMHQIAAEDFVTLARITAVKEFDRIFASYLEYTTDPDEAQSIYSEFMGFRLSTIQDDSLDVSMPLYLDEKGDLTVVVCISVPAAGGAVYERLPLERDISEWETLKAVEIPDEYYSPDFNRAILRLYEETGFTANVTRETGTGGTYESECYFGFDSYDPGIFTFQDYSEWKNSLVYNGSLRLVGMDENGFIFEFIFTTLNGGPVAEDDPFRSGTFSLNYTWDYNELTEEFDEYGLYRWIDGADLFDSGVEPLKLAVAYG